MVQKLPKWFLEKARAVTAKRAKTVIDHILKHGHITTEELKSRYGYDHPPRAARDVREHGIPLETFRIKGSGGKNIGAYRFADPSKIRSGILGGRKVFSKEFKAMLLASYGCRCGLCLTQYEARYLQVDHRIPYEIGGEGKGEPMENEFQLLCGSCNRAKSWSCEHCDNWRKSKDSTVCITCYWAQPANYRHVAMRPIRRLDLTWTGDETHVFDQMASHAKSAGQVLPEYVKAVLAKAGLK